MHILWKIRWHLIIEKSSHHNDGVYDQSINGYTHQSIGGGQNFVWSGKQYIKYEIIISK